MIPKPKTPHLKHPVIDGVRYYGKREVCLKTAAGVRNYRRRILEMAARQDEICAICREFMVSPTFDHEAGRGMAGSFREDSLVHSDGGWRNAAACFDCNGKKGSRRYRWQAGKYLPKGDE